MAQHDKAGAVSIPTAGKMDCFEGLRGLASLGVLIGHLIIAFWPVLYSVSHPLHKNYPKLAAWIASTPARVIMDGQIAVALFFMLSGFVLSLSFFKTGSHASLSSAAVRRYFRLMIPAAVSIVFGYAVLKAGLMYNRGAVSLMDATMGFHHQWLVYFYQFDPNWKKALRECYWDTFFGQTALYNQNLWTMSVEYAGSFLVYAFLALFGNLRRRSLLYLIVGTCLVLNNRLYMLEFMVGMMICDLYVGNQFARRKLWIPLPIALLLTYAALWINYKKKTAPYQLWFVELEKRYIYEIFAGSLIVGTMAFSQSLQRVFQLRLFTFLGKISFALYLVHLVLICSLASGVYLFVRQSVGWGHNWAAASASLACMSVAIGLSWLMYLYVDRPAIAIGKFVYERVFKKTPEPVAKAADKSELRIAA